MGIDISAPIGLGFGTRQCCRSFIPSKLEVLMGTAVARISAVDAAPPDTRRGGDVRVLLSPKTVGSTSGFMGVATIPPGDRITEHYHPYSEEFIYVVSGKLDAQLDGKSQPLSARQALLIPIN